MMRIDSLTSWMRSGMSKGEEVGLGRACVFTMLYCTIHPAGRLMPAGGGDDVLNILALGGGVR